MDKGLKNVLEGNPQQDRFDYDLEHPKTHRHDVHQWDEADFIVKAIQTFLEPKLSSESNWEPRSHDVNEHEEMRVLTYKTILPEIELVNVEYRYPQHVDWGITIRRTVRRVKPQDV